MRYHSFDRVRICETTGMQDGYLRIDVVNSENNFPIKGAEASISYGESGQTQEVLRTNLSGQTEEIAVAAPPALLSLEEQNREKPYADYTVEVRAEGYEPVKVKGTEVHVNALSFARMAAGSPADPDDSASGSDRSGGEYPDSGPYLIWFLSAQDCRR